MPGEGTHGPYWLWLERPEILEIDWSGDSPYVGNQGTGTEPIDTGSGLLGGDESLIGNPLKPGPDEYYGNDTIGDGGGGGGGSGGGGEGDGGTSYYLHPPTIGYWPDEDDGGDDGGDIDPEEPTIDGEDDGSGASTGDGTADGSGGQMLTQVVQGSSHGGPQTPAVTQGRPTSTGDQQVVPPLAPGQGASPIPVQATTSTRAIGDNGEPIEVTSAQSGGGKPWWPYNDWTLIFKYPGTAITGLIKGGAQGGLLVANGTQNQAIDLLNLGATAFNKTIGAATNISIGQLEHNNWAPNKIVALDDDVNNFSMKLGGSSVFSLGTAGLGRIAALGKLGCFLQGAGKTAGNPLLGTGLRLGGAALKVGSAGLGGYSAGNSLRNTVQSIANGDGYGAIANGFDTAYAIIDLLMMLKSPCFAAGTPLLTPDGSRLIEELAVGDWVLSAPEEGPGPDVVPRRVVAIFSSYAPLLGLHVGGQTIWTTAEHPFWVEGLGWTPAQQLAEGTLLRGHDGRLSLVDSIDRSYETAPVYNVKVEEYHTYFVGTPAWGFSAWAHNAPCGPDASNTNPTRPDLYRTGNTQGPSPVRPGTDIVPDAAGNVHPTNPPTGLSTYDSPGAVPTKGRLWRLPGDEPLPPGLGATPDAPPPGHVTIGPTQSMTFQEFLDALGKLPWVDTGTKLK